MLTDDQEERFVFMLTAIAENRAKLNDWERGFFDDQAKRHDEYGSKIHLSPKQWSVMDRMYEKVTDGHDPR